MSKPPIAPQSSDQTPVPGDIPRRLSDLEDPYSRFSHVDLSAFPDEPYYYGLGIRQILPNATWLFERWFDWNLFDSFLLYLNDMVDPVAGDTVLTQENRYPLHVLEHNVPRGEVWIKGRVERVGSGTPSESVERLILIKTDRPGGFSRDPEPGEPGWHTGLTLQVVGFPEGSTIDRDNIRGGLWCVINFYEHMRKNDLIDLRWDGIEVHHRVTPDEVAAREVRVFVSETVILQGSLLGRTTIRFRVQDVVLNYSGGEKYQYSKPYFLESELDPSLRNAPIFLANWEETNHVDLDTHSESEFTVLVDLERETPTPSPRYRVTVTVFGTLADGSSKTFVLPFVEDRNLRGESVPIPVEIIEQMIGGSFRISYLWHTSTGAVLGQSGSITVTVVGTPVAMPAPTITPIELGLIDPDQDCFAHIPNNYEPYDSSWLETLVMEERISSGGGEYYEEPQLAGAPGGTRRITSSTLQRFKGKASIFVYYMVDDGTAVRKSREIGVQVGERIANMPQARLQGVMGNNVNPADIIGPEVVVTFTYLGTLSGDVIHYTIIGSGVGGSLQGTIPINGGTAGRELPLPVSRDILDKNNNGSLRIGYSLLREGTPPLILRSEVLSLTVGVGVQLDRPIIEGASTFPDLLNPLAVLAGTYVRVIFRSMHLTDQIYVDWLSDDGIGSYTTQVQGDPSTNEVAAFIPRGVIAKCIRERGNRIHVQYRFMRGVFPYESEIVSLELQRLTGLPTPFIQGVGNAPELVLSQLISGARALTPVWPFIHPDSRIWMEYRGTFASDDHYNEMTYISHRLGEDDALTGLQPPAPIEALQRLMNGSDLTIQVWVGFSGSLSKDLAVPFPTRLYSIRVDYFRDLTDFYGFNWNGWANAVNGRGELAIEGAENVVWRASKTAIEVIEPGVQKTYNNLTANTQYEVSFYCKTTGSFSQVTARIGFAGVTVPRSVTPERNWERFSHIFTTPATPPTQTQVARITFSVSAATTFFMDQIQIREVPRVK
ncbi:hypothetical protein HKK55_10785 [Pseudomonas sp. ADAK18]|uniref:hypothetical protein n=1 Tax=Pseudomonas sp. ADAK18 TaxID=2730848 RepID=UPI0014648415|nr:hypothetical protein [Pseudomonas sp. ADAK18]QJI29175.1 hypothetical protein HKK55_10785 [Pseudomonas sp. ADAK18]